MPKFNVSCDLLVPVLVEIEAADADEAADKLCEMSNTELLRRANTEEGSMAIHDDSISVEPSATARLGEWSGKVGLTDPTPRF